jgi:hypothetical protein
MPRRKNPSTGMTTALALGGLGLAGLAAYAFSRKPKAAAASKSSSDTITIPPEVLARIKKLRALFYADIPSGEIVPLRTAGEYASFMAAPISGKAPHEVAVVLVLPEVSEISDTTIAAALSTKPPTSMLHAFLLPVAGMRWITRPSTKANGYRPLLEAMAEYCVERQNIFPLNPNKDVVTPTKLTFVPGQVAKGLAAVSTIKCGIIERKTLREYEKALAAFTDNDQEFLLLAGMTFGAETLPTAYLNGNFWDQVFLSEWAGDEQVEWDRFVATVTTPEQFARRCAVAFFPMGSEPGMSTTDAALKEMWGGKVPEDASMTVMDPGFCSTYYGL